MRNNKTIKLHRNQIKDKSKSDKNKIAKEYLKSHKEGFDILFDADIEKLERVEFLAEINNNLSEVVLDGGTGFFYFNEQVEPDGSIRFFITAP